MAKVSLIAYRSISLHLINRAWHKPMQAFRCILLQVRKSDGSGWVLEMYALWQGIEVKSRGRPRRYCSVTCRVAYHRKQHEYYTSEASFELHWQNLLRSKHVQGYDAETMAILKHICRFSGDYVAALTLQAIRTEVRARGIVRPKYRRLKLTGPPEEVESTIIYPSEEVEEESSQSPEE